MKQQQHAFYYYNVRAGADDAVATVVGAFVLGNGGTGSASPNGEMNNNYKLSSAQVGMKH